MSRILNMLTKAFSGNEKGRKMRKTTGKGRKVSTTKSRKKEANETVRGNKRKTKTVNVKSVPKTSKASAGTKRCKQDGERQAISHKKRKTVVVDPKSLIMNTAVFESLFKRYKEQDQRTAFAFFPPVDGDWDGRFRELAALARKGEIWESKSLKSGNVAILKNYLNYTFLRLQEEKKILFSKNLDRACFNTGLQTQYGKDIIATFRKNVCADNPSVQPWVHYRFWDVDSADLRDFSKLPKPAEYYKKSSDLFFDTDYDLRWKTEHIVEENAARLPESLKANPHLAALAIDGALKNLKARIMRNYKLAIPHWYNGRVQLLLPLCLTDDCTADLALVADKDKEQKCYTIQTILTMEMAYTDARLICRPDGEWLHV